MEGSVVLCPNCGLPRVATEECPRCGVIYSKADVRALREPAPSIDGPPPSPAPFDPGREEARIEWQLRLFAIPVALVIAWAAAHSGFTHMLMRLLFSMWVHESGHAVTAWFCGFVAFPLPWVTPTSETRETWLSVVLLGAIIAIAVRFAREKRWLIVITCAVAILLQAIGTLHLRPTEARTWITFGGDGGAMVLGTLLMLSMYADQRGSVRQGWLRWGFLVIGACAFADVFETWWASRTNVDRIPFGEIEGVGLSDPSRLVERDGWTYQELIGRYVGLGEACLVVLAIFYVRGLLQARAALRNPESSWTTADEA